MSSIYTILAEFRDAKTSNREMGDQFERLIANYLVTDPMYRDKFSDVWLWSEWPDRKNKPDVGIDLVARERWTGDYCAIQCKFYDPTHSLQKSDIDSFFTASGKEPFTSRIIVSTTDKWSNHAEDALQHQKVPVSRLRVQDLEDSPIDWTQFSLNRPQSLKLKTKKTLREHQKTALAKVTEGFAEADRGKIIMACGTGKTFTALKIAETLTPPEGTVLFLVPSISLLSQSLREWTAESETPLNSFAVCSDAKVGKKSAQSENEDISTHDLAFPATTNARLLAAQFRHTHKVASQSETKPLKVIFSTYQSIEAVAEAQKQGVPEFDLIICDEAHRTTGVTLSGSDESHFMRVHDQGFIKSKKRLYMTATPRIYSDGTKVQAQENDATLCSMDDESIFGKELYRLGFSEAVSRDLLSDYKVMVLAVDEKHVSKTFQSQIADASNQISLDDAVKITGCWNGLSRRMTVDTTQIESSTEPMRRAVAFSRSIKDSKKITELFSQVVEKHVQSNETDEALLSCEVEHVDGTFNALRRNEKLDWLKADTSKEGNICRVLSNARCLSEGVDVPALDAVMFLNARNSVVDVVQSVGRVMRKAEGKRYGYIILPIGIPADMKPEEALQDNQKYKVVWQVLQALRAHDDRFNATINKIELNQAKPDNIQVIGVGFDKDEDGNGHGDKGQPETGQSKNKQLKFNIPFLEEWRDAIYAKIVVKCGEKKYWETWAKDVAQIAERHIDRIKALLEGSNSEHRQTFDNFLAGLRCNLNPSISEADAIEMLAQHLITRPVFDALFEGYEFTRANPVSVAMQTMLDVLEGQALEKETASLEKFYHSVEKRAKGIDNAAGRQKIILELYDKFFKTAFPKTVEKLGIVYTPVPVVDFIIHSADAALRQEFGVGLADKDVHVLDPFTGTGTFIVRLLQSGLIPLDDLQRKYRHELHANEIILLAYYIAAINIEETYHGLINPNGKGTYQPFEGMVLTDTFQLSEGEGRMEGIFPANSERANRQRKKDIRVIIGNPPYSSGQESENDGNKNLKYPVLDEAIRGSYAKNSTATNKNSLYDSYIRAIRWASDRIKDKGIVCYVTNGKFIDSNAMDGVRKCLTDEFTSIYVFNLRGFIRGKAKDDAKREGQNVFDIMTGVAITLMVKNPKRKGQPCDLFYHDIGDYLNRQQKLDQIKGFANIKGIDWKTLNPNDSHDWINLRDPAFDAFMAMGNKDDKTAKTIFKNYSAGVQTNRDTWVYNFSKEHLSQNIINMINVYNEQVEFYKFACEGKSKTDFPVIDDFVEDEPKLIKWSRSLKQNLGRLKQIDFHLSDLVQSTYRPFCKQWLYFNRDLNHVVSQMPRIFPHPDLENLVICLTPPASRKPFSAIVSALLPDLEIVEKSQCFPLYTYEQAEATDQPSLFGSGRFVGYQRKDNIADDTLADFQKTYADKAISKEDVFYYVYGVLHSPEYKQRFESDLKKMLPRIPFAQDFWAFSKAGRDLAQWHLNYETIEPYPVTEAIDRLQIDPKTLFRVDKMTFGKQNKQVDKSTIIYNSHITLSGIPLEAYGYVVNGKPALEWIMERYQYTKDKDSQITNNPNDWSDDPRYILDLVKRIVRVSVESVRIVDSLPALNERIQSDSSPIAALANV